MKTTGLSLVICLVSLVSLGCQGQSLFGPSAEALAWQALVAEYDILAEKGGGIICDLDRRIYVTPIEAPELEAAFPDTTFFRGGARRRCVDQTMFDNLNTHSLVAVRGDQTYLMHINTGPWSSGASAVNDDNFRGFNRLLKDSDQTVTPENEIVIARAAVVMMLFYSYHSSFDDVHFASPEDAAPADYRLGRLKKLTRRMNC